jgi:hypothetical protein
MSKRRLLYFLSTFSGASVQVLEKVIVLLLDGQSNMSGRVSASLLPLALQGVQANIEIYNWFTNNIEPYNTGVNSTLDRVNTNDFYGMELYLATLLRDYHNKKVVIFKYSIGGTRLNEGAGLDWSVNSTNEYKDIFMSNYNLFKVKLAQKKYDGISKFSCTYQGENDALLQVDANAYQVQEALKQAYWFDNLPIQKYYNINVRADTGAYAATVRTAKITNANNNSNVVLYDAQPLIVLPDGVHLTDVSLQNIATYVFNQTKNLWVF